MKHGLMDVLRQARWRVRRAQAGLRHGGADVPALFANSFPKSGTHLLTQVLAGFSQIGPFVETGLPALTMFEGTTGASRPVEDLVRQLNLLQPGDIRYGHLHAEPRILDALCRSGIAPFFILRDPRDVVVSHVFYVTELEPNHSLHQHFTDLPDFDARLNTSILGLPDADFDFPDIRGRFEPYIGWLERSEVLVLKFEDFLTDQQQTLRRVLDHVVARGFTFVGDRDHAMQTLAAVIDPQRSPTFRSGRSGGWRERFTPAHKDLFKQVTGDLLVRLGYEEGHDW